MDFFSAVITILGSLALMATLDWVLPAVMAGAIIAIAAVIGLVMRPLTAAQQEAQAAIGRLGGILEGALRAIRTVKASRSETWESDRVLTAAHESFRQRMRAARIEALGWTLRGAGFQGASSDDRSPRPRSLFPRPAARGSDSSPARRPGHPRRHQVTSPLLRRLARTRGFTLGAPARFSVAPEGTGVLFLRSKAGDDPVGCLWRLDLATGSEHLLADPTVLLGDTADEVPEEERIRRERARQQASGITDYATDTAARMAAFALAGRLWTVDTDSGAVRQLPARRPVVDPRPSPDGRYIAYVSGGALRVIGADGGGDRAVAAPESAEGPDVFFGLPEHVASESMDRHRAYWWAPDGERLLTTRVDNRGVALWYLADPADPAKPPRTMRYPRVGTANAEVTLWIADLVGNRTEVRWDRAAFEYLPAAGWDRHGPFAAVLSRDQRTLQVLAVDPTDGTTSLLAERHDERWVELLVPGVPARTSTGLLVDYLDRDETRHLSIGGTPVTTPSTQRWPEHHSSISGSTTPAGKSAFWARRPDTRSTMRCPRCSPTLRDSAVRCC